MDAIRTTGLTKRYGSTLALDAVDLVVAPGEVYGFLGPNGAGKTTTIRLLLGLHRPSSGSAAVFGIDAWRDPVAAHRRLALDAKRRGQTVFLSSHILSEVEALCDRVGILREGVTSALAGGAIFRRRDLVSA